MADIQTYLKKILSAVYGKDVRQSIHDAIHQCYEDGKAGTIDLEARERIDQFTALESGSTTGDAELQDIRAGIDGETYSNAGNAVREQIRDVRSGSIKQNLLDFTTLTNGYLNSSGYLNQTSYPPNWELTSDFISVDSTKQYTLSVSHDRSVDGWFCVATYDSNKTFLSRSYQWSYSDTSHVETMTFNDNVKYVRVSYRSHMTALAKFEQSKYASRMEETPQNDDLLVTHPLIFDGYINPGGEINQPTDAGYIVGEPALKKKFSSFIKVNHGDKYVIYHVAERHPWYVIGFCDISGNGVTRIVPTSFTSNKFEFEVPENAYAMYVSARTYYLTGISLFKVNQIMSTDQKTWETYLNVGGYTNRASSPNVKSVAHRGFSIGAPENTLPAYRMARENGFTHAECDVSFTSDGVAVLLHDDMIDRTSNGTGYISKLTYDEVLSYDYGSWFSEDYAGTKIPTVNEFLQLCKNIGLQPYIELKAGSEAQITELVNSAKRFGIMDQITWISFSNTYLEYVKNAAPTARLGYVVTSVTDDVIALAKNLQNGDNEVFIDTNSYTDAEVDRCINASLPMEVWVLNDLSAIQNMPAYVSGVTSDSQHAGRILYDYSMEC